ncbi:MAG: hypothetical protein ROR55_20845 [Devosia sp.]
MVVALAIATMPSWGHATDVTFIGVGQVEQLRVAPSEVCIVQTPAEESALDVIAMAVATKSVELALSAVATRLADAAKESSLTLSAVVERSGDKTMPKCLHIVVGTFSTAGAGVSKASNSLKERLDAVGSGVNFAARVGTAAGLEGVLREAYLLPCCDDMMFIELRVVRRVVDPKNDSDRNAARPYRLWIEPTILSYGRRLGKEGGWRSKKSRDLVLTVTIGQGVGDTGYPFTLTFRDVPKGSTTIFSPSAPFATKAQQMPAGYAQGHQSFAVSLTETRDASQILTALSELFSAAQPEVQRAAIDVAQSAIDRLTAARSAPTTHSEVTTSEPAAANEAATSTVGPPASAQGETDPEYNRLNALAREKMKALHKALAIDRESAAQSALEAVRAARSYALSKGLDPAFPETDEVALAGAAATAAAQHD